MSVKFTNNIDLQSKDPNFHRDQFASKAAMKAYNTNFIDEGHLSYCLEDGQTYRFKLSNPNDAETGHWAIFSSGNNNPAENGKSAYEIAVENGFEGTETEWLESLKGEQGVSGVTFTPSVSEDGLLSWTSSNDTVEAPASINIKGQQGLSAYQIAIEQGFDGSEEEWIESLKGTEGVSGLSAYQVAVGQGFEGTEAEWLESLQGPEGVSGKSAYDIAVDNGFEGTEKEWIDSLGGSDSSNASVDETLSLIKVTQNGVTYVVSAIKLEKPNAPVLSDVLVLSGVNTRNVSATCSTDGAVMYYTIDGTDPTTESDSTTGVITLTIDKEVVSKQYTVKVIAVKNGEVSDIASQTYTTKRKVTVPTINAASGNIYSSTRTITIETVEGSTLKYRIGSTGTWTTYTGPITITETSTIYAKAEQSGWETSSEVNSGSIVVGTMKMYYKASDKVPTTVAEIEAMNALEANTFPQDVTFTESGYNYGCFAYNKSLGNLVTIWEYSSNANMLDASNPNWEKVGNVGDYVLYKSKSQADFTGAKFGMRK